MVFTKQNIETINEKLDDKISSHAHSWEVVSKLIEEATSIKEKNYDGTNIDFVMEDWLNEKTVKSMYIVPIHFKNRKQDLPEVFSDYGFQIEIENEDGNYDVSGQYRCLEYNEHTYTSNSMIEHIRELSYCGYRLREVKEWTVKEV